MGTRSITKIFDESGKPLLSFYRQFDGYFEGHGQALANFLKDIVIVNGYGSHTPKHAANGMGCLAAQLVKHFKDGIGGIYIAQHDDAQEYNYEIRFVATNEPANFTLAGRVTLIGKSYDEAKQFDLYGDLDVNADVKDTITFVYDKGNGERPKWRTIGLTQDNGDYIEGYDKEDGDKFKRFVKSRIIDGRILMVQ